MFVNWNLAMASQSACNLSGLAHSLQAHLSELTGQDDYSRLLVAQMAYLSHGGLGSTKDTPLDVTLPKEFPALVNGLLNVLETNKRLDTDARNMHPDVKRYVRALCECVHHSSNPFGWRWDLAYERVQLRINEADLSPAEVDYKLKELDEKEKLYTMIELEQSHS